MAQVQLETSVLPFLWWHGVSHFQFKNFKTLKLHYTSHHETGVVFSETDNVKCLFFSIQTTYAISAHHESCGSTAGIRLNPPTRNAVVKSSSANRPLTVFILHFFEQNMPEQNQFVIRILCCLWMRSYICLVKQRYGVESLYLVCIECSAMRMVIVSLLWWSAMDKWLHQWSQSTNSAELLW